jgi:Zn-dependent M28 family amino/carboxypeptidase
MQNFVGADDAGSSTGVMLEMARLLCGKKRAVNVWIAFLDGEEAQVHWTDTDSVYGSRQLAAKLSLSGDLKRVKAVVLADIVGKPGVTFKREENSTKWLAGLVWSTARRLGYDRQFLDEDSGGVQDDHLPFLHRGVPCVDIIAVNFNGANWHTPADTLDKISPRSLGITGHVLVESVAELEKKFHQ